MKERGRESVLERCISCSNVIENMFSAPRAYPSYPYSFIAHPSLPTVLPLLYLSLALCLLSAKGNKEERETSNQAGRQAARQSRSRCTLSILNIPIQQTMPTAPKAAATAATMQAISVVNYSTHSHTHTHVLLHTHTLAHTLFAHSLHADDKVVRKENFDFHAPERALPPKCLHTHTITITTTISTATIHKAFYYKLNSVAWCNHISNRN